MSITIGEGIALYRAGKSLLGGVRHAFKNRPSGKQAQQIQAFRTALEQRMVSLRTSSPSTAPVLNPSKIAPTQWPNQQRIAATLAEIEQELGKVFSANPIDTSRPAILKLKGDHVIVTNDHIDKARLEALFADRPHLQQLVHRLDIALRAKAGINAPPNRATTLTIGPHGITAALERR